MTNAERDYIIRYRESGKSCAEIARILGLSANTVKSFCQRNSIVPITPNTRVELPALSEAVCLCCGEKIEILPHRKTKRFCSDACRLHWWHTHRDMEKNANATLRRAASLRCRNGQLWPLGEPKGRGLPELRLHRRSHRHWSQMKPTR